MEAWSICNITWMLSHGISSSDASMLLRCSILSHLRRTKPTTPWLSVKIFHSPSPLVSHLPLFTFTHLGLSIAPGIVSYMCNARRHKRAQGNSCDYGGMIPSGLTRLLTKLFDHTNSECPEASIHAGRNVISGSWRDATIKLQFGNEIANVINTL